MTIFGRLGLEKVNPTLATALRAVIMAAALVALAFAIGQLRTVWDGTANLDGRAWTYLALAGACGAISWLAYFAALRVGPPSGVAALDRLSIAFIFVLGMAVLGERHTWRGWVGLALLVAGVWMVAGDRK